MYQSIMEILWKIGVYIYIYKSIWKIECTMTAGYTNMEWNKSQYRRKKKMYPLVKILYISNHLRYISIHRHIKKTWWPEKTRGLQAEKQICLQGKASFPYFLRFIVFSHISIKPVFASLSGKSLMAAMALSAYSWAKARVCSTPLLWWTSSRAW